jgi:dihydroorotate dehydrogenase (NAD+) catalytic subunit
MGVLETKYLDISFKNPVVMASGTYGMGQEYEKYYPVEKLGGFSSKGLTWKGQNGNKGIRIWETPAGLMNSIGLENPGVKSFIKDEWPKIREMDTVAIVNYGAKTKKDFIKGIELLNETEDIQLIELNISCPNVKEGGMAFGTKAEVAADLTKKVVKRSKHPVMVKLSPNAENIADVAKACEDAGAHGLSLINTLLGMAVDYKNKKAVFNNIYAGLSGPAVMPVALRMTHQVVNAVDIPVMAMGGITTWEDALQFIMTGATCVQVGTANFIDPMAAIKIIEGLEQYCIDQGLENISEVRGII